MKKPETLAKIAIAVSIVALAVAIYGAVRPGHRPPMGFRHDGISERRGDFRSGPMPGDARRMPPRPGDKAARPAGAPKGSAKPEKQK
ncbi:MAG: hypothetical protein LBT45_01290 [Rickettsiales bacterium]|jgi:hypothetical protein|nr:hypothetical protein [Rickettsiales bacterium]